MVQVGYGTDFLLPFSFFDIVITKPTKFFKNVENINKSLVFECFDNEGALLEDCYANIFLMF